MDRQHWPRRIASLNDTILERVHFGYDAGGRAVADAALALMTMFPTNSARAAGA